jgi:hypothetical protein
MELLQYNESSLTNYIHTYFLTVRCCFCATLNSEQRTWELPYFLTSRDELTFAVADALYACSITRTLPIW